MTIDDKIRNDKLQYDINRKAAKISALLSGKIDKYEYVTGEETLPSNQRQIIGQAKFAYSPCISPFAYSMIIEVTRKVVEESKPEPSKSKTKPKKKITIRVA